MPKGEYWAKIDGEWHRVNESDQGKNPWIVLTVCKIEKMLNTLPTQTMIPRFEPLCAKCAPVAKPVVAKVASTGVTRRTPAKRKVTK